MQSHSPHVPRDGAGSEWETRKQWWQPHNTLTPGAGQRSAATMQGMNYKFLHCLKHNVCMK